MNERIKRLWEQSTGAAVPEEGFYSSASKYNIEKFAGLIVRECVNICDDIADPCLNRNQDIHQRMAPGASYASKVIKLRFSELKNE